MRSPLRWTRTNGILASESCPNTPERRWFCRPPRQRPQTPPLDPTTWPTRAPTAATSSNLNPHTALQVHASSGDHRNFPSLGLARRVQVSQL
eukprot:860947-Rhodomonas_salina.1